MRLLIAILVGLAGVLAKDRACAQEVSRSWPPPAEVHSLLQALRPDLPEPSIGATNTESYLRSLEPEILLKDPSASMAPSLTKTNLYSESVGYLRIARVDEGLPEALRGAGRTLVASGGADTLILDLRFAGGSDFPAATNAAGLLVADVLASGSSKETSEAIGSRSSGLPFVILVNRRTRGAAEILGYLLREAAFPSLILGTPTAGQAREYREVQLPGGGEVGVAVGPYLLSDGRAFTNLLPDILVSVSAVDEELYFTDEFRRIVGGRPVAVDPVARMNEAELTRRRRGLRSVPILDVIPAKPPVQDPALARGIDLLDSLSALRDADRPGVSR